MPAYIRLVFHKLSGKLFILSSFSRFFAFPPWNIRRLCPTMSSLERMPYPNCFALKESFSRVFGA
jgi:hypothetical protein